MKELTPPLTLDAEKDFIPERPRPKSAPRTPDLEPRRCVHFIPILMTILLVATHAAHAQQLEAGPQVLTFYLLQFPLSSAFDRVAASRSAASASSPPTSARSIASAT